MFCPFQLSQKQLSTGLNGAPAGGDFPSQQSFTSRETPWNKGVGGIA
jgi:hypothetical protein